MRAATFFAGLAAFGALALQYRDARASSNAGIELELGSFRLRVYYSDAVEYHNNADAEIRDPRSALFTLASVLQANAESFKSIHHTVEADLYTREGSLDAFLSITEDPQTRSALLGDGPAGGGIAATIVKALCNRYSGACRRLAPTTVRLYRCRRGRCPGRIRFGAFPSDSVDQRFGLLPPTRAHGARSFRVTSDQLGRYFRVLDQ